MDENSIIFLLMIRSLNSDTSEMIIFSYAFLFYLFPVCSLFFLLLLELNGFNHDRLLVTLWTVAHQAPLSMGFSRQEHWSGLSFPPPGNFPDPGIEHASLKFPALAGSFFTTYLFLIDLQEFLAC